MSTGGKMIVAGVFLLLTGAALPFMIVLQMLQSTWFLNSLTVVCQVGGFMVGFIGMARVRAGR